MFRSPTTPPGGHSGSSQRSNATAPVRRPFGSSPFDFERLTGRPAPRSVNSTALSPFPATLAGPVQLHENAATLSPAFATLTKNRGGGGTLDKSNRNSPFCPRIKRGPAGDTPCHPAPSCIDSSVTARLPYQRTSP